ncbi:hypothetical protein BHE74_00056394 [Ensete ventricosum]|nr:hypothetical protein BHE74_00056394 [Ensete ventricosum]RZS10814.1 hypothetical protein BHM03_00042084 [Ensete ventricosum]
MDDCSRRINHRNFCLRPPNQINPFEEEAELSAACLPACPELSKAHGKAWASFCFHFFVSGWPAMQEREVAE